jgi:hypothetical protein
MAGPGDEFVEPCCLWSIYIGDPYQPRSIWADVRVATATTLVQTQPLVVIEKALGDRDSNHCTDIAACWFSAWMNR